MPSKKSSKKAVVAVTDDELYDWVKTIYKEEELDPESLAFLNDRQSDVFLKPLYKDAFLDMRQLGRYGGAFSGYVKLSSAIKDGVLEVVPTIEELDLLNGDAPVTFFQYMTVESDFITVDTMIRLGADTDLTMLGKEGEETTLSMTCKVIERDHSLLGHIHPGRSRVIRRLLQVGVDPNIGYALHHACEAGDIKTAALLLEYGADSSIIRPSDGKRPHQLLPIPLRKRFQKLPRTAAPPKLCWCLKSGKPLDHCHGNPELPIEYDPFFGCPCRSGKTYGKCCQKQGFQFTETRNGFHLLPPPTAPTVVMADAVQRAHEQLVPSEKREDTALTRIIDRLPKIDNFAAIVANHVMRVTTNREQFDPAYGHAMAKTGHFPRFAVGALPKNILTNRGDDWNAAVDDYIATRDTLEDDRDVLQIEQQSKILWDGTRLYKECAGCGAIEEKVREFKGCSRCKMRQYCSKECQVLHWKSGHKHKCGNEAENENETLYVFLHLLTTVLTVAKAWMPSLLITCPKSCLNSCFESSASGIPLINTHHFLNILQECVFLLPVLSVSFL